GAGGIGRPSWRPGGRRGGGAGRAAEPGALRQGADLRAPAEVGRGSRGLDEAQRGARPDPGGAGGQPPAGPPGSHEAPWRQGLRGLSVGEASSASSSSSPSPSPSPSQPTPR